MSGMFIVLGVWNVGDFLSLMNNLNVIILYWKKYSYNNFVFIFI